MKEQEESGWTKETEVKKKKGKREGRENVRVRKSKEGRDYHCNSARVCECVFESK